jgi:hypothetical protein
VKIKGISPVADHWRTKAEDLERQCARQSALLREVSVYRLRRDLRERIKRELEGK